MEDEVPPGATAAGDKAAGCSVNSDVPWPTALGTSASNAVKRHNAGIAARPKVILNVDSDRPKFNMNRFSFK